MIRIKLLFDMADHEHVASLYMEAMRNFRSDFKINSTMYQDKA